MQRHGTTEYRLTRRQAIRMGVGALLAAGMTDHPVWAEQDASDDFIFLCVNDLHYFDAKCDPFFRRMVDQMNAHGAAELCLIVGDLADSGTPQQYEPLRDHLKRLAMPYHVVIGNHDHVSQDSRNPFEDFFPKQINYTFEHRGWQFVAADSTQGRAFSGTSIAPETLTWLGETAARLDARKPTIFFTHFPLGEGVKYRPKNADDALKPFKDVNLRAIFNGHYHAYTEHALGDAGVTTDKCCSFHRGNHDGTKERGYFLCRAKAGRVERTFVEVSLT